MIADAFFESAPRLILDRIAAGDPPASLKITSALYRYLDGPGDWLAHANRAQHGFEPAHPLYGYPVAVDHAGHQAWEVITEAGRLWTERGEIVFTVGRRRTCDGASVA